MKEVFISTIDNPFDYFKQFDEWLAFDRQMGYFTLEYVGRLVKTDPNLSEEEQDLELDRVFDSIIEWNGDLYKRVYNTD